MAQTVIVNYTNDRLRHGEFPSKELFNMDNTMKIDKHPINNKPFHDLITIEFEIPDKENIIDTVFQLGMLVQLLMQNK